MSKLHLQHGAWSRERGARGHGSTTNDTSTGARWLLLFGIRHQSEESTWCDRFDGRLPEVTRVARHNAFGACRDRGAGLERIFKIRHDQIAGPPRFGRSNRTDLECGQYFVDRSQRLVPPGGLIESTCASSGAACGAGSVEQGAWSREQGARMKDETREPNLRVRAGRGSKGRRVEGR